MHMRRNLQRYTVAAFEAASGAGWTAANNLNADPLFVSVSDFHIQPGGPGIDKGVDVGLTVDYTGRQIQLAPDIGAYETETRRRRAN